MSYFKGNSINNKNQRRFMANLKISFCLVGEDAKLQKMALIGQNYFLKSLFLYPRYVGIVENHLMLLSLV
jgi:hypothetical protein